MKSEQSEKKPKKKKNSGFLTLNPRISNIPQETQILWIPNNNYQLSCVMFFIQTHCCPILFIGLMLFSYSCNTPFVSARSSPLAQILASGPPVHARAQPAVSIFEQARDKWSKLNLHRLRWQFDEKIKNRTLLKLCFTKCGCHLSVLWYLLSGIRSATKHSWLMGRRKQRK